MRVLSIEDFLAAAKDLETVDKPIFSCDKICI